MSVKVKHFQKFYVKRCHIKTQTKQIKSHISSLVSAYSFGKTSLRPTLEWKVNRLYEIKECLTTVRQVFFSFTSGGILSEYLSLPALHLSGTPSLKTNTSPPSCQLLHNWLFMSPDSHIKQLLIPSLVSVLVISTLLDFFKFKFDF